jgi:hypothetical protein
VSGVPSHYQNISDNLFQLKKVVRRTEPVYLVYLSQMGVEGNPAENSQLPNAWEWMLTEFEDIFPTDQPGLPPERSVAMKIGLEEGAKPVTANAMTRGT